eukprot:365431-Chlamydomonas_euryale.AAC.8
MPAGSPTVGSLLERATCCAARPPPWPASTAVRDVHTRPMHARACSRCTQEHAACSTVSPRHSRPFPFTCAQHDTPCAKHALSCTARVRAPPGDRPGSPPLRGCRVRSGTGGDQVGFGHHGGAQSE